MHPTSVFHWTERSDLLAFIAERAFLTLAGTIAERLVIAQAPALVDRDGDRLLLHLSRGNPMAHALQRAPLRVIAVAHGPDAYVSPDWYTEAEQVPTWNYVSVEVDGILTITDDAMLREILDRQSAMFEARLTKQPWTVDKLSPSVLAAKLKGIVGATLSIDALRGTRKLSQNKSAADRAGVIDALANGPRDADRAIARVMATPLPPR